MGLGWDGEYHLWSVASGALLIGLESERFQYTYSIDDYMKILAVVRDVRTGWLLSDG